MRILIVGSGNVAQFLLHRLYESENKLSLYARNTVELQHLCDKYNSSIVEDLSSVKDDDFDVIILAISDSQLANFFTEHVFESTILVHCSGATSLDVLTTNAKLTAVFWPIYSIIADKIHLLPPDLPIAVETNAVAVKSLVTPLLHLLTSNIVEVDYKQRLVLHTGATLVNNFSNHLYALTQQFLVHQGLTIDALKPIMLQQALTIPHTNDFSAIQTGAAVRNDTDTISKHEVALSEENTLLNLYRLFTPSIISLKQHN